MLLFKSNEKDAEKILFRAKDVTKLTAFKDQSIEFQILFNKFGSFIKWSESTTEGRILGIALKIFTRRGMQRHRQQASMSQIFTV